MSQFKPMVKMMTTEPSIELKLKKGGKVEKKMQMGGSPDMAPASMPSMPARGGMMGAAVPMRPSMAARRRAMRAMPAGAAPAAPVGMAAQVMKEGGETKSMHKAEMAKTSKALKEHADKPASKAHKGLNTGGVVMGQGGYKMGGSVNMAKGGMYCADGGIINTENQGGGYRNTKMHDGGKKDVAPKKTGGVKMGKPGGYATGGVAKANAGGYKHGGVAKMMGGGMAYKKGGAAKKAYAAEGVVDSGAPVAMPQGRKKPTAPVSITEFSGTFKKGGKVTAAEGRLQKAFTKENATAMKQAKAYSNEVYSKYGKKMKEGGVTDYESKQFEDLSKGAYDRHYAIEKAENEAMREAILGAPRRLMEGVKGLFRGEGQITKKESEMMDKMQKPKSVTKTKESVTVTPGKKRGGLAC